MEKLKDRSAINDKYKWDLWALIKDEQELENKINEVLRLLEKVISYKGKIMESSDNLYCFYQEYEKFSRLLGQIAVYTHLNYDQDTTNNDAKKLQLKIDKLYENINEQTAFINSEILSVSFDKVEKFINSDDRLKPYYFDLKQMFKYKEHTLSEKEEAVIAKASNALGYCSDVFDAIDNTDVDLGMVSIDGKETQLTQSNYSIIIRSDLRNVRKDAFLKMHDYYKKHIHTISANYLGNIKEEFFFSKVRNFKNPLERSLYDDDISVDVYTNLIQTIHNNLDKVYRYYELKRQFLNVNELHMYDVYAGLNEKEADKISFDEGKEISFNALKPLGDEYLNDLKKAFIEKWVDIYPNKGKKSGAYSSGCYDSYPYVLLNYENNVNSVSTLVHELGHSMHSYYTNANQPYLYSGYSIFLAEIASTVNEMLLNDYLYKNAQTDEEKIKYLIEFLEVFRATIYRQTMFAEFEMQVFDKYEKGISLTKDELCETYYELNKLYFGSDVIIDDSIKYEWARIPHFYTPFYVYKYATGLSAALSIVTDILEGKENARENYLTFLKSGSSDYPLEILKRAGVDMTKSEPIERACNMFEQKVNELEKILNSK